MPPSHLPLDIRANAAQLHAEAVQDPGRHAIVFADEAEQQVLGAHVVLSQTRRFFLSEEDNTPSPLGEPLPERSLRTRPWSGIGSFRALIRVCWHTRSPGSLSGPGCAEQPSDGEDSCCCCPHQLEKSATVGALVWCLAHVRSPQHDDCRDRVIASILSCLEAEPTTRASSSSSSSPSGVLHHIAGRP